MMTRFFSHAASAVLMASALTLGLGLNTAHAVDANNPDTVERQVSLVFLGEMYDEDEKNQSPAGEFWDEPAPFELVVRRYKNTYTLGYSVEIIDPEPLSHPLAVDSLKKISRFSGGSKFSNSDSISNPDYCKGLSDLVSPGTEPGRFRTKVHCTSPFVATVESGYFFVSKLDAHGDSSSSSSSSSSAAVSANTRAKFPDDTQCLPKRKGTVYEPVIQIDKGGVTYPLGKPSLYGLVSPAGADPKPANKWQFTAVAKDPETNENMPFGFDYRWTVSSKSVITTITRQSATFEETIEATYGIGRFYPKLEIWKTHERTKNASGAYVYTALSTPVLVAKAEIHSLAVENTPTDNVVVEVFDQASAIFGTRCMVSNDVGGSGQAVDAKMEIVGSGDIRGRVTLDGYPQNEYWATSADNEDLYQVDQCIEGATSIRIQGYKKPSASDHDLKLKVAGQTFIEACIADYRFKGGPVNWSWTPTDSEPFMSSWMVKVPDVAAVNPPEPQPPVAAATGSTVTVRFEKFVNIAPAPSGSSSSTSTTGAVAGDFIRFVLKDGSDVTQTLADYLANVNAPQTRKAKIAITGQRYQGNKLELDLEIGPDVSVGWYHADAKWGADHAYVSSETVYGSSGTFRMKEAIKINRDLIQIRRKGQSAWNDEQANIAAGGLNSDLHIAQCEIFTDNANVPITISLVGGLGYSTSENWWWNGEKKKNAIFRLNGEEIEAGDGRSITIPHHSGTVIGEVISSNRVGQIMVMATMGKNSADSVIVNCNPGVIELTPDPGNEIDFIYKWRNLKAQLTFEGEPLQGHDIVLSCQTLTQSDDTFEETSLGSSVDDSRFLTAFIWFGLDEGKFQLLTTGKDGICNFRYQVRGFNKEFNFMSMDQHVAKRLFE